MLKLYQKLKVTLFCRQLSLKIEMDL